MFPSFGGLLWFGFPMLRQSRNHHVEPDGGRFVTGRRPMATRPRRSWFSAHNIDACCFRAICLLLTLACAPVAASANPEHQVADHVFLVRDDAATSIKFWLVVRAGYRDELDSEPRGIAHY